jgi:hypothetical protein
MENYITPTDPFAIFWLVKLTAKQRKARMELAFAPLKKVAAKQIAMLEKYERSAVIKENGFTYFITTVKNAWDNIEFAIEIGKGRFLRFSYYPTRTVLESLLRLVHYCRQTGEPYRTIYADIAAQGDYPPVEEANPKDDPFPNMKKLTEETPAYNKNAHLYFSYEALCELSHGKMIAINAAVQDELAEHVRSLMGLQSYACNLLRLVDHHIQGVMAKEIEKAIKEAEAIIKKDM